MKTTAVALPIAFLTLGLLTGTWWPLGVMVLIAAAVLFAFAVADLLHRVGINP